MIDGVSHRRRIVAQHQAHDHGAHAHLHMRHNGRPDYGRAFAFGIVLNLAYVAAEASLGALSGSLALLADAGHNLGDVLALGLSWGAAMLSRRQPSGRFTYGLRSSSILAALANAIILLVVTGGIAWEGLWRLSHPVPVAGGAVRSVARHRTLGKRPPALLFAPGRAGGLPVPSARLVPVA